MKKIIAILFVAIMAFAILPSISAPVAMRTTAPPGSALINDYCSGDYYILGTFNLGPDQSISYNIPATACPPVKREQIGLVRTTGVPIGDLFQIGQNESDIAYSYNCYYKDSCSDERTLHLCVTQGNIRDLEVVDI